MSDTGGIKYDEFCEKMNEILARNFSTKTPQQTALSPGLDNQTGLIVGAIPDAKALYNLYDSFKQLPTAWAFYDPSDVHVTFGAFEDPTSSDLGFMHRDLEASVAAFAGNHRGELKLNNPRLLASKDTIVLSGTPSFAAFTARNGLLNGLNWQHEKIRRGGWGFHATIARSLGQIPDDQRGATDTWLHTQQDKLPHVLRLTDFLVGSFTVSSRRFRFNENHFTTFLIR
jgi:hypothetical protein